MNRSLTDDRFAAALTLAVMIGSTAATGAALFGVDARPTQRAHAGVVHMPAVEVTGRRETATAVRDAQPQVAASGTVRLPNVTITGRRLAPLVAAASAQRISASTTEQNCVEVAAPAPTSARAGRDA